MSSALPSGVARGRLARRVVGAAALVVLALAGCSTASGDKGSGAATAPGVIKVVAAENFWGSLATQLGGPHVKVTSIIDNPDADPHDYEPTAADGREIATAKLSTGHRAAPAGAAQAAGAAPAAGRTGCAGS